MKKPCFFSNKWKSHPHAPSVENTLSTKNPYEKDVLSDNIMETYQFFSESDWNSLYVTERCRNARYSEMGDILKWEC